MERNRSFNIPNLSPSRRVIEYGYNNTGWYRLYDDGWVEQGGYKENNGQYILPVEMANADYNVYTGAWYYSASAGTPVIVFTSRTTTVLELQGRWNGGSQNGVKGFWAVCGKSARGATQQTKYIIKY